MRAPCGCLALVVAFLSVPPGPARAADPADLLGWVPARANAALLIDVDALYRSEIARNNKWGSPDLPTTGLDSLPGGASKLVIATQFAPGSPPSWEVSVLALKKPVSEADFAKRNDGTRETIADKPVVLTPRHGYVANLAPGVAGAYTPPNRPDIARWLREANGKAPAGMSEYLKQAAARVGPTTPVVLAVDTADMLDYGRAKDRLGKADALKGKAGEVDLLVRLFAGMKGVTLTMKASDKLTGELRLDFSRPAAPLAEVGKPLILEALARIGAKADEMDGWAFAVKGDAVTLSGPLTPDAADQLVAPLLGPGVAVADPDSGSSDQAGGSGAQLKASLKYFRATEKIINEVRNANSNSFEQLTFRLNNGARRIDDLPILNVDDELLDWGGAVATTLRTMAIVAQKSGGMISLAEANKAMVSVSTPNYYYGSGYAGGVGYWGAYGGSYGYAVPSGTTSTATASNYGQIDNLNTMTNQKEFAYRQQTWDTIKKETTSVRRKMVKKYGVEF
ncbi:MAG: hypothetical protein K2X87_30440 [Gemmataceae bacterium]|nr:hypothetical protein [Gemmataceae bacterium]